MSPPPDHYHAFLLRLWQIQNDDEATWLASLEDSRSGEKHGFASLEALLEYLRQLTGKEENKELDL